MKKVFLIALCAVLTSCSNTMDGQVCPYLSVVTDGSYITKYEEGTDKIYTKGLINREEGYCMFEDNGSIIVNGAFSIYASIMNPAERKTQVPMDYFIAILDEDNNVVLKNNYTKNIKISKNSVSGEERISFNEIIDLEDFTELPKYNVLISFQLTEAELKENRDINNPY